MNVMTNKRCSECGEFNPSYRKSTVCNGCKYRGVPHAFVKPSNALRRERFHLSAINCHCEHAHENCTDECSRNDCFRVGAPLDVCGVCVRDNADSIHNVTFDVAPA